jgi:cytochrome d ubiquinol oxidase subunit II
VDPSFSLTVTNASSTPYTLKIMTWVAVAFTPVVLLYQGWTYWVFRRRLAVEHLPPSEVSRPPATGPSRLPR